MATGKEHVGITAKRIMGSTDFGTRFLDYLKDQVTEMNSKNYSSPLWLEYGANLAADGSDRIQVTKANSLSLACDGVGHFLDLNPVYVENDGLYFENASAVDYHVHIKYASIPTDIQINPIYGHPEYTSWQDQIGMIAQPNSVTDNGGTITFNVTSVTESGVSNAGRKCLVWMNSPANGAVNKSIAIEECTVQWSGGINQITTTGTLGQTTVNASPTEYKIALLGPRIQRYSGATIDEHVYVGTVTGAGAGNPPTTFNTSGQIIVSQSWIDIFGNGLNQHFFPAVDNTYDLGTASQQWRNLYVDSTAFVDTLDLSDAAGEGVDNHFVPTTDDTYNLGSATYQWQHLYVDGVAYLDTISLSDTAGEGFNTNVVPTSDNAYDLGNATYEWRNLYLDGTAYMDIVNLSTTAGTGVTSDIVPTADDTYDLGNSSYGFQHAYINGSLTLGVLNMSLVAGEGCTTHFVPTVDDTYDLGNSSYEWRNLRLDGVAYIDTLNLSNSAGEGSYDLFPRTDDAYQLGTTGYRWQSAFIRNLHVTADTAGDGVKGDLIPAISNASDLGASAYYWKDFYAYNIYYKNTLTTFDIYNDLKLIEGYSPTSEIMTIEKAGKEYAVNKGDVSTIPWPMLGKKDPSADDYFLDLSDSTMFLLGAIKQLYQLHKREIEELKDQLSKFASATVAV